MAAVSKLLYRYMPMGLFFLAACSFGPGSTLTAGQPTSGSVATLQATQIRDSAKSAPCELQAIAVPTMPANRPGYTEIDPATGLHITGSAPEIDLASYRLNVTGKVDHPLSLTYDELRCMPKTIAQPLLDCPGYFEDSASWGGVPLKYVLELAGIQAGASGVFLNSQDGYFTGLSMVEALSEDNFLAYEWDGEPLPILHGFPLRAVFPGEPGGKWVKWLVEIEVY